MLAFELARGPVDHPQYVVNRDEVAERFELDHVDMSRDSLLGFDAGGELIACGFAMPASIVDDRAQVYLLGAVHPEYRRCGIGSALMAWEIGRAKQLLATRTETVPAWIMAWGNVADVGLREVAEGHGMALSRYFATMRLEPVGQIRTKPLPDGLEIGPFEPALSDATRLARNDIFRDHWGSQPTNEQMWQRVVTRDTFRPELSRVVIDPETNRVVGLVHVTISPEEWEAFGTKVAYIELIGVRREWRGKGVASAAIAAAVAACHAIGIERIDLDVDSASPTGANTLYAKLGFVNVSREASFVLEL